MPAWRADLNTLRVFFQFPHFSRTLAIGKVWEWGKNPQFIWLNAPAAPLGALPQLLPAAGRIGARLRSRLFASPRRPSARQRSRLPPRLAGKWAVAEIPKDRGVAAASFATGIATSCEFRP
jgi:hypothetical protein